MEKKRELESCAVISPQLWDTKAQKDISEQVTSKVFMQSGEKGKQRDFQDGSRRRGKWS